jgi:hypothetical protein
MEAPVVWSQPYIEIVLSEGELLIAHTVGGHRQIQNLRENRYTDAEGDRLWQYHIEGAAGELAFAKYLGVYWSGALGDLNARDVGGYEVRTRSRHDWDMPIYLKDANDKPCVLLTGLAPRLRIRGWLYAGEGKRGEYWADKAHNNRPAYFVPSNVLRPMTISPADFPYAGP